MSLRVGKQSASKPARVTSTQNAAPAAGASQLGRLLRLVGRLGSRPISQRAHCECQRATASALRLEHVQRCPPLPPPPPAPANHAHTTQAACASCAQATRCQSCTARCTTACLRPSTARLCAFARARTAATASRPSAPALARATGEHLRGSARVFALLVHTHHHPRCHAHHLLLALTAMRGGCDHLRRRSHVRLPRSVAALTPHTLIAHHASPPCNPAAASERSPSSSLRRMRAAPSVAGWRC